MERKKSTEDSDAIPEDNSDKDNLLKKDDSILPSSVHLEIEKIGINVFHKRLVIILGLGNVADAVEILAIGYILTVYEREEGALTGIQSSLLAAAVFVGMLLGGFTSGIFSDKIGRRPVLLSALALNGVSGIGAAVSPSIYWLILFRTGSGFGVGGTVTALFSLCVEHLPIAARGFYVTILCSFWMLGSIFTAGTAWIMLGDNVDGQRIMQVSWRWFALVVSVPSLVCCFLSCKYVPESARFLEAKGQLRKAEVILNHIAQCATSQVKPIQLTSEVCKEKTLPISNGVVKRLWVHILLSLFRSPQRATTLALMIVSFCQSFGSYGLATWITKLFKSVGLANPFANAFLYAGANLPGNLISAYVIDIFGKTRLLAVSMALSSVATLFFAFHTEDSPTVVVSVACVFNACATSAWNALGVVTAEAFPTKSRGTGMSMLNSVGRFGAIVAQFVNGLLVGPPPHVTALLIITSLTMLTGSFCAANVPRPPRTSNPVSTV